MGEEAKEEFDLKGAVRGLETTDDPGGKWKKQSIKVENDDGKTLTISSFDEKDHKVMPTTVGKKIALKYTSTQKGEITYRNLVKGSIEILGEPNEEGEPLKKSEEEVVEEKKDKKELEQKKLNEEKLPKTSWQQKDEYWDKKFVWEKENNEKTQIMIVRQNSYTQALKYVECLLEAKKQGIKVELDKDDMKLDSVQKIAHTIEEDIMKVEKS